MAAILSVLNGGSVAQTLVLQGVGANGPPSIQAVVGGRYVLASADGRGAADGMIIKRAEMNLLLAEESDGSEKDVLTIEDFFVSHAQLFGLCTDGKYQPYRLVADEATKAFAAEDARGTLLQLASSPATAVLSSSLFAVDGSVLSSAAGHESAPSMVALSVVPVAESADVAPVDFEVGIAATRRSAANPLADVDVVRDAADSNGGTPKDVFAFDDGRQDESASVGGSSDVSEARDVSVAVASGRTREAAIDSVLDGKGAIQGNIPNGGFTDDGSPRIVGKTESGVLVHIYKGAELIGIAQAGADGTWSFVPRLPLADGRHVISVMYEYGADDFSDVSAPYVIFVDTVAPDTPIIIGMKDDEGRIQGQIGNGTTTDDSRPVIDGVAEANATVVIYDKGVELGRALVGADGKWSFSPGTGLEDGLHILEYAVVDRAGNASEKSSATEFLVDTRPELVEIYAAEDDVGLVRGTFMSGGVTDDTQPRLFGAATAGGTVKVYEGQVLLGEATAGVDGKWELIPAVGLSEGAHNLAATVTTAAKGESGRSTPFVFTVDITAPDKPTIEQVYDDRGTLQSALSQGQSTDDTTPTLSGKAEAGATIRIYDSGNLLGNTVADAAGKWSFTPSSPLLDGGHMFTATAQDKAGSTSAQSDGFSITIDTVPPASPVISLVIDDQGSQTGALNSGDWTDDSKPTISGSAEAYAKVVIRDHGLEIGHAVADAKGKWSFEPFLPMGLGPHKLTAEAIDAAGNTSARSSIFELTLGSPERPAAPAITSVVDDVGLVTGVLQKNDVTDDARPTVIGTAQAGTKVSIYVDGALVGSTLVGTNGEWSYTPTTDLVDGLRNITAKATSAVGNVSDLTGPYPIIVDTTPPVQPLPADATLWDDVGQITGQISNGTVTDDNTPTFVGKAEANATVVIYDGGAVIGRVQTNASGDWKFTPSPVLVDGQHSLNYEVVDKAGNVGPKSPAIGFEVNTNVIVVSIDGAVDDVGTIKGEIGMKGVTDDPTPTLHGVATAGGTVKVYEGSTLLGQVLAGSDGKWNLTPSVGLSEGLHSLSATVTTATNGESAKSAAFDFTIDLTAPATPTIEQILDNVGVHQGALKQGQSTDDGTPTLSGKAEVGSTVNIYDKGSLLASVTAGEKGDWSYTPNPSLPNGAHEFTVKAADKAGNVSQPSAVFDIVIDTVAPGKPMIDLVYDDEGARTGNVAAGGITDDSRPTISGRAEAGCIVIIMDGELELGRAVADANGKWALELAAALADGGHALSIQALDAAGNLSVRSDTFELVVDTSVPTAPRITNVRDDVGEYIGILQSGGSTDDANPTINGTGKVGELIEIRSGAVLLGSTVVGENGRWSFTPEVALSEGAHGFSAIAVSLGGAESAASNTYAVRVDTIAPDRPIIDAVRDNVGAWMGDLENGQTTDDRTPTFVGKAEPSSTIIVFKGGEEVGFATVDELGGWTYTAERLAYGEHRFTFQSFDVAGNVSDASDEWVVVVAMAMRSAQDNGSAELPVSAQELLAEARIEFFSEDTAQRGTVGDPGQAVYRTLSIEAEARESWAVSGNHVMESNDWSAVAAIGLDYSLEQHMAV